MPTDEEIESEECADVYSTFGAAMHVAQVLEHSIVNAMIAVRMPDGDRYRRTDIDALMDKQFGRALAELIRLLKSQPAFPDNLHKLLTEAVVGRNYLAHRIFRERNDEMYTSEGRAKLVLELCDAHDLFTQANTLLNGIIQQIKARSKTSA